FSFSIPQFGFGDLQRIAGRIAEINRARAVGPVEIGLDGDAMLFQMFPPAVDLRAACGKTYMTRPCRAIGWHRQMAGQWRFQGFRRLEEQQYALPAAEKRIALAGLADRLQSYHPAIEVYRLGNVADIKCRFKDTGSAH